MSSIRGTAVAFAIVAILGFGASPVYAQRAGWPSNPVLDQPFERTDFAEVLKRAQPMADAGDGYAQHMLALLYDGGWGVERDHEKAAAWYQKAAEQGVVAAQNNLAGMYVRGDGVTKDYAAAVRWFQKASDGGAMQATFNLGQLYEKGLGVPRDYKRAAELYRIVALNGLRQWESDEKVPAR